MGEGIEKNKGTDRIKISGMSCEHCVAAVRKGLEAVPGVLMADERRWS